MSYVPHLHQITPQRKMIFPLLCYCLGKKRPQVARCAKVTEGRAGPRMARGRRCGADSTRGADAGDQGHRGQRGAKEGQRTQGIGGGIDGAMQRGRGITAANAPQRLIGATMATHPTRLHPTLRWQTYRDPAIGPPQKLFPPKLNQRMRYQLCVKQSHLQYTQRGFMYSGVYTRPPPPCLLFTDAPYPLLKGRYPLLNIFRGLCFGLGGG